MITPTLDVSPEDYPAAQFRTLSPRRPAHLDEFKLLSAVILEHHAHLRSIGYPCPLKDRGDKCGVCDHEPGRHVAGA